MPDEIENPIPAWRQPPSVTAPAPTDNGETITLRVSNDITNPERPNSMRTQLYQAWAHLAEQLPPIRGVSILEDDNFQASLTTLHNSVACFEGVKRPLKEQDNGANVITYILTPTHTVESKVRMGGMIAGRTLPRNKYVFTVQVVLNNSLQNDDNQVEGTVTRLEFVKSAADNNTLPENHDNRYDNRLW